MNNLQILSAFLVLDLTLLMAGLHYAKALKPIRAILCLFAAGMVCSASIFLVYAVYTQQ